MNFSTAATLLVAVILFVKACEFTFRDRIFTSGLRTRQNGLTSRKKSNEEEEEEGEKNDSEAAVPLLFLSDSKDRVLRAEIAINCSVPTKCAVSDPVSCSVCKGVDYVCRHFDREETIEDAETGRIEHFIKPNEFADEGYCVKHRRCNPYTSDEIYVTLPDGSIENVCACKYPYLVDKANLFSDCDVVKACRPLGAFVRKSTREIVTDDRAKDLDFDPFEDGDCACDESGLVSERVDDEFSRTIKLGCVPPTVKNLPPCYDKRRSPASSARKKFGGETSRSPAAAACQCPPGHVSSDDATTLRKFGLKPAVHVEVFERKPQCVKIPCRWDVAEPNSYNDRNEFVPGIGCLCDYRNGWVGVNVREHSLDKSHDSWVDTSNLYNACVRLTENSERVHRTVTYFYTRAGIVTKHYYSKNNLKPWVKKVLGHRAEAGNEPKDADVAVEELIRRRRGGADEDEGGEPYSKDCYFMKTIARALESEKKIVIQDTKKYFGDHIRYLPGTLTESRIKNCDSVQKSTKHFICRSADPRYDGLLVVNFTGMNSSSKSSKKLSHSFRMFETSENLTIINGSDYLLKVKNVRDLVEVSKT